MLHLDKVDKFLPLALPMKHHQENQEHLNKHHVLKQAKDQFKIKGAPDLEFSNPAGTGFTGFGQKFRPDLKQDILG